MLIMALGQTFVIIAGGIDLSVALRHGPGIGRCGVVMSRLGTARRWRWWCWPDSAAALVAGLPAGLVNGVLVARLRVPPFIGTLGMYGVTRGAGFSCPAVNR